MSELSPVERRDRRRRRRRQELIRWGIRVGILLLVSLGDRCAEIISDAGVEGPLPDEAWRPCLDGLLAEVSVCQTFEATFTLWFRNACRRPLITWYIVQLSSSALQRVM